MLKNLIKVRFGLPIIVFFQCIFDVAVILYKVGHKLGLLFKSCLLTEVLGCLETLKCLLELSCLLVALIGTNMGISKSWFNVERLLNIV